MCGTVCGMRHPQSLECRPCKLFRLLAQLPLNQYVLYNLSLLKLQGVQKVTECTENDLKKLKDHDDCNNFVFIVKVKPVHYVLKLQAFIQGNMTIQGFVEVELEILKPTNKICLHMVDLNINEDTIKIRQLNKKRKYSIGGTSYNSTTQQLALSIQRRLRPGSPYLLSMNFTGKLSTTTAGFYIMKYKDEQGYDRSIAATQFWAIDARRAFPCFDEPGLKASFDIYLARTTNYTAISNMPVIRTNPIENQDGWVWDQFATSIRMSTYLVAFAIIDYTSTHHSNRTQLQAWTRSVVANQTNLALDVADFSLNFYEKYFAIDYPLPKMDMVALPQATFRGMENWGLVIYRESDMIYSPESPSAVHQSSVSYLVAHELAHQWFGNLVTFSWWTDLWLNEGFATYMAYLAVDAMEPEWGMLDQFVVSSQQDVMALDVLQSSHPISVPVEDPAKIHEVFDDIPYNKEIVCSKIILLFFIMQFLYISIFHNSKYGNAEQDDLWKYLTQAAHKSNTLPNQVTVKEVMDTWTLQEGFPVVTVERSNDGTAKLTQKHFSLGNSMNRKNSTNNHKWWIPITFTTEQHVSFKHTQAQTWLSASGNPITVTGLPNLYNWTIFNIQMTGYYRVNYDEYSWSLLARQLQENHDRIHVCNRAQIIDDSLTMARAGMVSYNVALNITKYLAMETSYVAWKAFFNNLDYLNTMFRQTAEYGAFKVYVLSLLQPLYVHLGLEDAPEDDLQIQLLRVEVVEWACRLGHSDCVSTAQDLFQQWMDDPESFSSIPANIAGAIYCSAINRGSEAEWLFAMQAYLHSNHAAQKKAILHALGCTKHVWLLNVYFSSIQAPGSGIYVQDAGTIFSAVASSEVGSFVSWHYLSSHWETVQNYLDGSFLNSAFAYIVKVSTKHFCTVLQIIQLESLLDKLSDSESRIALQQALEVAKNNHHWVTHSLPIITTWLDEHGFTAPWTA
ncbi:unnamed protein product, partial [Meganyctiphanes norvegica]